MVESWKEMRAYIVLSSTRHSSGLDASQRHLVDQFGGTQEFELLEFLTRKATQDSSSQITCLLVLKVSLLQVNFHASQSWVLEPALGRLRATLLWQDVTVVTTHLVLAQLCNCLVALLA